MELRNIPAQPESQLMLNRDQFKERMMEYASMIRSAHLEILENRKEFGNLQIKRNHHCDDIRNRKDRLRNVLNHQMENEQKIEMIYDLFESEQKIEKIDRAVQSLNLKHEELRNDLLVRQAELNHFIIEDFKDE